MAMQSFFSLPHWSVVVLASILSEGEDFVCVWKHEFFEHVSTWQTIEKDLSHLVMSNQKGKTVEIQIHIPISGHFLKTILLCGLIFSLVSA